MSWRKSWSKFNIFGKNGDGVCSKRKLLPDERSVLDDYLDLAEISHIRGSICIAKNIGYTIEQLSQILVTPSDILARAEKKLVELKIITVDNNRVLGIINWTTYQSEYERQKPYRVTGKGYKKKLQHKVTKKTSVSVSDSISLSISVSIKEIIKDLNNIIGVDYKSSSVKTRDLINARLSEGFTIEDFKKVHRIKFAEWGKDEKMSKFLRPETLYSNKFEGYLNQAKQEELNNQNKIQEEQQKLELKRKKAEGW